MRTTYRQPPAMKGKKYHYFSCGCCVARNMLDEEREKIAWQEARDEIETIGHQQYGSNE